MLDSVVESKSTALKKRMSISEHSVNLFTEGKIDKSITADLDYSNFEKDKDTSSDGLITTDKDDEKKFNIKIPGCVVKKIDRTNIVPIYIEDICMGYYYFEFKENDQFNYEMKLSNTIMTSSKSSNGKNMYEMGQDPKHDQMLRYISGQLSKFIDSKFINKNCDLRREIYMILKHNDLFNTPSTDKIKVTFLPPEDVIHVYFKKDEKRD
jgi:hypothetical protein